MMKLLTDDDEVAVVVFLLAMQDMVAMDCVSVMFDSIVYIAILTLSLLLDFLFVWNGTSICRLSVPASK